MNLLTLELINAAVALTVAFLAYRIGLARGRGEYLTMLRNAGSRLGGGR